MDAIGLNITDWVILGVVIASGIISLFRGFTKEFLSLFLWVFSFIAAISLEYLVSPFITGYIGNPEISKICLLYTSPSPRDVEESRMPSSA